MGASSEVCTSESQIIIFCPHILFLPKPYRSQASCNFMIKDDCAPFPEDAPSFPRSPPRRNLQRRRALDFSEAPNSDNCATLVAAVPGERDANGRGPAEDRDSRGFERRERLRREMGGPQLSAARGRRDPGARAPHERPLRCGLGRHRRGGGGGRAVAAEAGARIRRERLRRLPPRLQGPPRQRKRLVCPVVVVRFPATRM